MKNIFITTTVFITILLNLLYSQTQMPAAPDVELSIQTMNAAGASVTFDLIPINHLYCPLSQNSISPLPTQQECRNAI